MLKNQMGFLKWNMQNSHSNSVYSWTHKWRKWMLKYTKGSRRCMTISYKAFRRLDEYIGECEHNGRHIPEELWEHLLHLEQKKKCLVCIAKSEILLNYKEYWKPFIGRRSYSFPNLMEVK